MRARLVEPSTEQILAFCAEDPVERVFLEDVARRGHGRFAGARERRRAAFVRSATSGRTSCPPGAAAAPSPGSPRASAPRMLIGEQGAVTELWEPRGASFGRPREDRLGQPVYVSTTPPEPGGTGLRAATRGDLELLVPPARARTEELGVDPLRRDPNGFRWRTRAQIEEGRSWLWVEDGVILLQGRGLGVDAGGGAAPAGLGRSARPPAGERGARRCAT